MSKMIGRHRMAGVTRLFTVALAVAACGEDSGEPNDTLTIAAHAGATQNGTAGEAVPTDPAVRVTNQSGQPVSGVAVTFAVTAGGGSVTGGNQTTGSDGVATVGAWTLGNAMGANTLSATAAGSGIVGNPVAFTAAGGAGAPAAASKQAGDAQTATVGQAITTRPAVRVVDAHGNPVANAAVTFAIATGGGTLTGATQTTDASGIATVGSWTLGTGAGQQSITATVTGNGITGNPLTFTATANAGPAATMTKVEGDGQTAVAGQSVATPPAVLVVDAHGNPVSGVMVDFAVTGGGGSVPVGPEASAGQIGDAALVGVATDQAGIARAPAWTLGPVGGQTVVATAQAQNVTGNPATFTATAALDAALFAGNWAGNWNNTTFSSSGTATLVVAVTPAISSISFTLDLNGNVFGLGNPPAEVFSGTYSVAGGFSVSGASVLFGNLTLSVSPIGVVTGQGLNPTPGIARVDFTGTATTTSLSLAYTLRLANGSAFAVGTLTLNK